MSSRLQITVPSQSGGTARTFDLQPSLHVEGGAWVRLSTGDSFHRRPIGAHFSADDARRIGAWLVERYGLAPYAPKVGETVRILPDAERHDGDEVDLPDTTRAKVVSGLDCDGEYNVRALDGDDVGESFYVAAAFIRHRHAILPEAAKPAAAKAEAAPTPAIVVGQEYRLLPDSKYAQGSRTYFKSSVTRVRALSGVKSDGNVRAEAVDGTPGAEWHVSPAYLAPLAEEPKAPLKVGDVVDLTPNAKTSYGGGVYFSADVTRVKVEAVGGRRPDGDYFVTAVNGSGAHGSLTQGQYVGRAYLGDPTPAPLPATPTATPAEWVIGDMGVMAENFATLRAGDRVQVTNTRPRSSGLPGQMLTVRRSPDGAVESCLSKRVARPDTTERPWAVGDIAVVASEWGTFRIGDRVAVTQPEFSRRGDKFVPVRHLGDGQTGTGTCLAHRLARPSGAWAVGDIAIVTHNRASSAGVFAGDRVRITEVQRYGGFRARFVSGRGRDSVGLGVRGWHFSASDLRRP